MEVFTSPKETFLWIAQNSAQDCRILCIDSLTLLYYCDLKPATHPSLYQFALNKKQISPLIELKDCSQLFVVPDWEYKRLKAIIPLHFNTYENHHLVFACKGKKTKALNDLMAFFH